MNSAKRAWFQIHFSTAIVLMIAVSILLGLSLQDYNQRGEVGWPRRIVHRYSFGIDFYELFCELLIVGGSFYVLTVFLEARARGVRIHRVFFGIAGLLISTWIMYNINFSEELICNPDGIPCGFWWGWPLRMTECGYIAYRKWNETAAVWNALFAVVVIVVVTRFSLKFGRK